jgi:hypothetical protein
MQHCIYYRYNNPTGLNLIMQHWLAYILMVNYHHKYIKEKLIQQILSNIAVRLLKQMSIKLSRGP